MIKSAADFRAEHAERKTKSSKNMDPFILSNVIFRYKGGPSIKSNLMQSNYFLEFTLAIGYPRFVVFALPSHKINFIP